jgi:GNAT superfamily N-acetyltransferase
MNPRAVLFGRQHIAAAAELLAEAGRGRGVDTADPAVAAERIERWAGVGTSIGFAAVEGPSERVVGFLAVSDPGERKARVRLDQQAAVGGGRGRAARRVLYGELSARLVAAGVLNHEVDVLAGEQEQVAAFVQLGFGIDQIKGFRPAAPAPWAEGVRRARPDDLPRLVELAVEVVEFHAGTPMWQRPDPDVAGQLATGFRRALEDGPGGPHLLLVIQESDGRVIGLMQAAPDSHFVDAVTIGLAGVTAHSRQVGVGTALLDAVADWTVRVGRTRCGAGWTSASPVSDGFWRGRGLVPETFRLARVIPGGAARSDRRGVSVGTDEID